MKKIRQSFSRRKVDDVNKAVSREIEASGIQWQRNARIAVAVGSRGIADILSIVKSVVREVEARGASPFVIPAMGSHGGATPEGQRRVLAAYGITEKTLGVSIRSSMEVVELPRGDAPCRIYADRTAWEADGIIIINRIKSHTDFYGTYESGLVKMCVVGLGKHRQALEIHGYGTRGLREYVPACAREVLTHRKIVLGIGIVENAYHETALIKAIKPEKIFDEERHLLELSQEMSGKLPVKLIDILVVDEFGKDISGTGLDTKVIGRLRIENEAEPLWPRIKQILLCDLTDESHGNALGIGLADVVTRKVQSKIDLQATNENVVTSTFIERGRIPIVAENAQKGFEYALRFCRASDPACLRVVRIKNTLRLDELYVSEPILRELRGNPCVEQTQEASLSLFDETGELSPF
ncbi:MAG TPA: DUF2088 domain-containing protein [Spirochaetia bacterium]|nr:DUF2088 domain-containing protein [Spirochaetia bacterium]